MFCLINSVKLHYITFPYHANTLWTRINMFSSVHNRTFPHLYWLRRQRSMETAVTNFSENSVQRELMGINVASPPKNINSWHYLIPKMDEFTRDTQRRDWWKLQDTMTTNMWFIFLWLYCFITILFFWWTFFLFRISSKFQFVEAGMPSTVAVGARYTFAHTRMNTLSTLNILFSTISEKQSKKNRKHRPLVAIIQRWVAC